MLEDWVTLHQFTSLHNQHRTLQNQVFLINDDLHHVWNKKNGFKASLKCQKLASWLPFQGIAFLPSTFALGEEEPNSRDKIEIGTKYRLNIVSDLSPLDSIAVSWGNTSGRLPTRTPKLSPVTLYICTPADYLCEMVLDNYCISFLLFALQTPCLQLKTILWVCSGTPPSIIHKWQAQSKRFHSEEIFMAPLLLDPQYNRVSKKVADTVWFWLPNWVILYPTSKNFLFSCLQGNHSAYGCITDGKTTLFLYHQAPFQPAFNRQLYFGGICLWSWMMAFPSVSVLVQRRILHLLTLRWCTLSLLLNQFTVFLLSPIQQCLWLPFLIAGEKGHTATFCPSLTLYSFALPSCFTNLLFFTRLWVWQNKRWTSLFLYHGEFYVTQDLNLP